MISKKLEIYLLGQAMTLEQRGIHDLAKELRGFLPTNVHVQPEKKEGRYRIIKNRAQCLLCGDIVTSTHVHDYVSCDCKKMAVDGGLDYCKRTGNLKDIKDLSVYEEIKE